MVSLSSLTRSSAKCADLLSCFLDLNDLEVRLFYTVIARSGITLDELADSLGKDRSTVFRNLQKLVSLGIIYKDMFSLDHGGRIARYFPNDISEIRRVVEDRVNNLKKSMDAFLLDFEEQINNETLIYGTQIEKPSLRKRIS